MGFRLGLAGPRFARRWGSVVVVAALLAVMATANYRTAQQSHDDVMYLVEQDLPVFDQIQELRARLAAQESVLYRYYVTADGDAYRVEADLQYRAIDALLQELERDVPEAPVLGRIRGDIDAMRALGREFDDVMSARPIDWDEARRVLAEFSPVAASVDPHSSTLTAWVRRVIAERARGSLRRIRITLAAVTGFGFLAIVAGIALWRLNARRLAALHEQERLISFPRRNPYPVLALTAAGDLSYANDAAVAFAERALGHSDPVGLLPAQMSEWLRKSRDSVLETVYQAADLDIHLVLHWLADFQEFHVYLADVTDSVQSANRLRHMAFHDALTGLPNRSQFNERFPDLRADSDTLTLVLLDIDRFNRVVTSAGHRMADRVLCECASRLDHVLRASGETQPGELFRFDGNLFCVLWRSEQGAFSLMNTLRASMTPPIDIDGREFYLSLSIGVVSNTGHSGASVEELLRKADSAMRAVKATGGNAVRYYDSDLDRTQLARIRIENELPHALERRELKLLFQPQLSLHDGRIFGAEALLRWHPSRADRVSPAEFVPIAEDSGQIVPIGNWVLEEACRRAVTWRSAWGNALQVAVNISARQLVHGNLAEQVEVVLSRFGMDPSVLELEITESAALSDYDAAVGAMNRLRELGVQLSLDDFGTGFSSLGYLQRLPVHKIKIDQSFVRNMIDDAGAAAIVRSVIALSKGLGLTVIAEGVESHSQLQLLRDWGCDEIQGYLLGMPMASAHFLELLHQHDPAIWRLLERSQTN